MPDAPGGAPLPSVPSVLGRQLVLAVLSINLVLSLLATGAHLYASYRRDAGEVLGLIDVIDASFGKGFEDALWEYNFELVDALLDGVFTKSDVRHVVLESPSGRRWERGHAAAADRFVRPLNFWHRPSGEPPSQVGTLTVGLTLDNVASRTWAQLWMVLAANVAKSAVASIAMLLLFGHVVTRHLRRVAEHVSRRGWLQQDEPLALARPARRVDDEIDLIVNAINASRARAVSDYGRIAAEVQRRAEAERLSADRAAELARANRRLAEASREQAEYTYALAHDLKAPIATVTMLLRECECDDVQIDAEATELLLLALETNARMSVLVDDVLAYSRTVGLPTTSKRIDLARLLPDVLDDLRADIVAAEASVTFGQLPAVSGNASQMRMLLQNLLSNAIKFRSPERSSCIGVHVSHPAEPGFVRIVVSDNGIGIDARFHESIFKLFQRLHGQDTYAGSGVGLALCKRVVENQGGTVAVDSEPDAGTRFTLTLREAA